MLVPPNIHKYRDSSDCINRQTKSPTQLLTNTIEKYITGAGNQKREPAFVCLAYQLLLERKIHRKIIDYVEKQDEKNCGYVSGIETASELEETETAEEELVTETEKLSMDSVSVEITYTFWYYTTYEQEQELTWAVNKAIKSMGLEMGINPLHFQ